MTKKEVFRKVLIVFSRIWLCYITVKFFRGKASILDIVCMVICYFILGYELIDYLCLKIDKYIFSYCVYKKYAKNFKYMQFIHNERYKLYFTGSEEEISKYSKRVEDFGAALLEVGEKAINDNLLNQKHTKRIQEMLEQTKKLMTTVN